MSTFRFKRFEVVNERSAMKVNTDGVLLGALMTLTPSDRRLLDVGTGTGTIALMAAQRLSDILREEDAVRCLESHDSGQLSENQECESLAPFHAGIRITAVDIDEASASEAAENFRNSPWPEVLEARNISLDGYASRPDSEDGFDVIFSNPPYFDETLQAPDLRRNNARHTSTGLSYRELIDFAAERLSPEGRLSLVLPADTENSLTRHARMMGLHLLRIVRVRTVPRKAPVRIIAEFSRHRCLCPEDRTIAIHEEGKYSEEYLSLTHEFYLFA